MNRADQAGQVQERRDSSRQDADRRAVSRGGRRQNDRKFPWWRGGLAFAALCLALRCRRWVRR